MGIASVIGIFIQGFRSFALTFLRSSLGGEIASKKKEYAVPKRRCRAVAGVRGLFYCNNKFPFGRSEFLLIYSCNVDQITSQPQNLIVRQELW